MDATNAADLERLIEAVVERTDLDPTLLAQLEELDEALWDAQFAVSTDTLRTLAEKARQAHEQGQIIPWISRNSIRKSREVISSLGLQGDGCEAA